MLRETSNYVNLVLYMLLSDHSTSLFTGTELPHKGWGQLTPMENLKNFTN
jgi:hypothetical protein